MNTVRKNHDAHSPFMVAPSCEASMRGFVFCGQLLLKDLVMFIPTLLESCSAEGTQGNKSQWLAWGAPLKCIPHHLLQIVKHQLLNAKDMKHRTKTTMLNIQEDNRLENVFF